MKSIIHLEKIINIYKDWKPSDVAFLKKLQWSDKNLIIVFCCQLRINSSFWPNLTQPFFDVNILFKNVLNFKLDFKEMGLQQITGFDIVDISDDGLERINFKIEDYENDIIYFLCESIEVESIEMPQLLER